MTALRYGISDTLVLAKRSLLRIPRQPDLLVGFTVQPILFVLLFVYVFGGAIQTPGFDYVDFLIPGIMVQSIVFGGFVTALGLSDDLKKGLMDRFRSLPMSRSALLTGRTLGDVATNVFQLSSCSPSGSPSASTSSPAPRRSSPGSRCSSSSATRSRGSSRSSGSRPRRRRLPTPTGSRSSFRSRSCPRHLSPRYDAGLAPADRRAQPVYGHGGRRSCALPGDAGRKRHLARGRVDDRDHRRVRPLAAWRYRRVVTR